MDSHARTNIGLGAAILCVLIAILMMVGLIPFTPVVVGALLALSFGLRLL